MQPFLVKENDNGFIHLIFPKNGKVNIFSKIGTIQYSKFWNKQMNEAQVPQKTHHNFFARSKLFILSKQK